MSYETDILEKVRAEVRRIMSEKIDQVGAGRALTWDDYKHKCGYISALRDIEQLFDQTTKEVFGEKG
jgi:hypothetical protein